MENAALPDKLPEILPQGKYRVIRCLVSYTSTSKFLTNLLEIETMKQNRVSSLFVGLCVHFLDFADDPNFFDKKQEAEDQRRKAASYKCEGKSLFSSNGLNRQYLEFKMLSAPCFTVFTQFFA